MYKLSSLFIMLITLTVNAETKTTSEFSISNLEFITLEINQFELEANVFSDLNDITLNVEDIKVVELAEEVEIAFDTTEHLPENFNELAGKNDINWLELELVELVEDVEITFDTTAHLPENFNPLKGRNDIDWSKVELIELEEEIELGFDAKNYLPQNFNPYNGLDSKKEVVKSLY